MLFEQDGYKTFGEKMLVVSCCKFVTSQALTTGDIFIGEYEQLEKFWSYSQKCTFQTFCGIFKEGWYKK